MISFRYVLFLAFLFDILAIGIAVLLGFVKGDVGEYFGEHYPITWLSFFQLLVISGLSWTIFNLYKVKFNLRHWRSPHFIWAIIAAGFLFLALDEKFGIHEALDKFIHWSFNIKETSLTDRLDSILIGLYGLVGIITLYFYREELKKYVVIYPFLLIGFAFLLASVGLDALVDRDDIICDIILKRWLVVAEESFKILSECVFLVGFYGCFKIAKCSKVAV